MLTPAAINPVESPRAGAGALPGREGQGASCLARLVQLAPSALARMYVPEEEAFAFKVTPGHPAVVSQGLSRRYTAISVIGLSTRPAMAAQVLGGTPLEVVCGRLLRGVSTADDLGDVALTAWAAAVCGHPDRSRAWRRLEALRPSEGSSSTVETAWALAALSLAPDANLGSLRDALAARLMSVFDHESCLFAHTIGRPPQRMRAHVSCFADLVYPVHALAAYSRVSRNRHALAVAAACAEKMCALQGAAGQWWWHYDHRTGRVVERYPVYAIHQDAMAPLALFALEDAGGPRFMSHVTRGLAWLAAAPELAGGSLVDMHASMVWRKVARREPRKASRYLQAAVSAVHRPLPPTWLDRLFPPSAIDYEDRPYHWGWLLHAWPEARAASVSGGAA